MRNGQLIFTAVQFLMIAALLGLGAAFFALHFLHGARLEMANWILENSDRFLLLGFLVMGIAAFLALCLFVMQRKKFLRIRMEKGIISVDEALIKSRIRAFWKEAFPEKPAPSDVYIAQQKIEVITEGQLEDLEEIEARLGALLSTEFGYEKPFFVTMKNL